MAFITGASLIPIKKNEAYYFFNGTQGLSDNYTFNSSQFQGYQYLDYILVGGGGGGAIGDVSFTIGYGAGGGGSGDLKASFSFNHSSGNFNYLVTPTVGNSTINLTGISSIQIQIGTAGTGATIGSLPYTNGGDGGTTQITLTGSSPPPPITANGGQGGIGVGTTTVAPFGGLGGNGFNGGGGGATSWQGQSFPNPGPPALYGSLGVGGTTTGTGSNGINSSEVVNTSLTSGAGGGSGAGLGYSITYDFGTYGSTEGINVGGGGGAGSGVTLQSGQRTGGDGTGGIFYSIMPSPPLPTFPDATSGVDYTGAGGGGGSVYYNINLLPATFKSGGNGGKGYAILYFHN